ncbi:hypothetical protein ALC57_07962 [Trachymyrmex cornetzi]|uniref:Double jelly roll-like domain-containing protein n=1 Tax=Trachymyrmex cornetzi TaxID=471704 RepID=A0A151J7G3_9HYME|nr:hypothetical protein ALC57_07962 [Trachymyrmex cornetzi]
MPHVLLSEISKLALLRALKSGRYRSMAFRSWDLYRLQINQRETLPELGMLSLKLMPKDIFVFIKNFNFFLFIINWLAAKIFFLLQPTVITDIEKVISTHRTLMSDYKLTLQPFVIVVLSKEKVAAAYVIINDEKYQFQDVTNAIAFCWKSFFVLNAAYPVSCEAIWIYIEEEIYECKKTKSSYQSVKWVRDSINNLNNESTDCESQFSTNSSFELSATLYGDIKMSRIQADNIITLFHETLNNEFMNSLKEFLEKHINKPALGEFKKRFNDLQSSFSQINSEHKCFEELRKRNCLIDSKTVTISNIMQTDFWKSKISESNKITLPLFLYEDDFECGNPLGSHTTVYKMSGMYISLSCLPPEFRSKLDSIFLFQIVHSRLNSILGFTTSFNSNFFCRFCKVTKNISKTQYKQNNCFLRNKENYDSDVMKNDVQKTGIRVKSVWNDVLDFHITQNFCVDIMHDLLEGVCNYEMGLILHQFICIQKLFTLEVLNFKLKYFKYPVNDNKPPLITALQLQKKYIKLSAAEMKCFILNASLIFGDLISRENIFWNLYILLRQIVRPLIHIWTMRFEAKHRPLKQSALMSNNKINLPLTIAIKHQLHMSTLFLDNKVFEESITYKKLEYFDVLLSVVQIFQTF